jgi:hypothetical protein
MEDYVTPNLLASTGDKFTCSIAEFRRRNKKSESKGNETELAILSPDEPGEDETNYFKSIQW